MDTSVEKAAGKPEAESKHLQVRVLYNGVRKQFKMRPSDTVKALLDLAIVEFGPIPNPHTLSLFDGDGNELQDSQTLQEAGVEKHEALLLRPSTVKGGA